MNKVQKILIGARNRVASGWTQYALGRFSDGERFEYLNRSFSDCVCFCAIGAIHAETKNRGELLYCKAVDMLEKAIAGEREIGEWNDAPDRTQAEVVAAFNRAIELAGEQS